MQNPHPVAQKKAPTMWMLSVTEPLLNNFPQFGFVLNLIASVWLATNKAQRWVHNAPPIVATSATKVDNQRIVHATWQTDAVVRPVGESFGTKTYRACVGKTVGK